MRVQLPNGAPRRISSKVEPAIDNREVLVRFQHPAPRMPTIGTVDERFQSYNIEMVEIIGRTFWKPYGSTTNESKAQEPAPQAGFTLAGIDPNLDRYRAPIDLSNSRLRNLAAALSPAYVRVSGTWANTAYFQDSENAAPADALAGFSGVLTREEWKGVVDFSHEVNAEIVTSVATRPGSRDAQGVWTSDQARQLFEYTKAAGGRIAASEFMVVFLKLFVCDVEHAVVANRLLIGINSPRDTV